MKALIALILMSSVVIADSTIYRPKKMTCAELRDALENYKVITVRYGLFDISRYSVFESSRDARQTCGMDQIAMSTSFRTKDSRDCRAGYVCGDMSRR